VIAAPLLVGSVAAVGVLHTLVPDHWAPIVVIARQRQWSRARTIRAAALAGVGHVTTTLLLGVVLWALGASVAARYGHLVSVVSAVALIAFGLWIAVAGWRELRGGGHGHHDHGQQHEHEHDHAHQHDHEHTDAHHEARTERGGASQRTTLILILGSSPMVEGLPAFLAASTYGLTLLATMAAVFAASTIITYATVTGAALHGLRRISLGPLERYGEVLSGLVVAAVGVYALRTA
jgi:ABC-type nickel/cobalt efflux system permease component RcnA